MKTKQNIPLEEIIKQQQVKTFVTKLKALAFWKQRLKKRGVINLEALGGNLVHFFGESIEVVDGVVDGVNYVDRGNCGVPVAGDDENWRGCVRKDVVLPWLKKLPSLNGFINGQSGWSMRYVKCLLQRHIYHQLSFLSLYSLFCLIFVLPHNQKFIT